MNRREFMVTASGVTGGAIAATAGTPVAAQDDEADDDPDADDAGENGGTDDENGGENDENGNGAGNGGGGTETVSVVDNEYQPDSLTIEPGTTVQWIWEGNNHNINPTEQPDDADWEGHLPLEDEGFEYEFTFEIEGSYEYVCDPHVGVGMVGTIEVTEDAEEAVAAADVDIDEVGVPIQKHFVGVATFLAIFISLVFTFYLLKYGESPHSSSPGRGK